MIFDADLVTAAYREGVFPMADPDGTVHWYRPDPRAIIPLESFHCPKSLARVVRAGRFEVRRDASFDEVIDACATVQGRRSTTWISPEISEVYRELHARGLAHSVETWREGVLVGGLYGVTIGGLFAGESMFSRERDASKVALVHLVEHLRARGFVLLDIQFITRHLHRFGAIEISADAYEARLAKAMQTPAVW